MRFVSILMLWGAVFAAGNVFAGDGAVCLGRNLSVVLSEHSERLYITIGNSTPIYFYKPTGPPRIVAQGLDANKSYPVKIYFDGKLVQSWYLDFKKQGSHMVNLWRAKGAWRMEPNDSGKCSWPPE